MECLAATAARIVRRTLPVGVAVAVAGCGTSASGDRPDGGDAATVDSGDETDGVSVGDGSGSRDGYAAMDGPAIPDAGHEAGDAIAASDAGTDAAADAAAIVAVPLTACPQGDYSAPLSIGGSQSFSLVLDTGSTTLGVASSQCTTCDGVTPVYDPGASATNENMTAESQYVTGYWSGEIYEDTVAMSTTATAGVKLVAIDSQDDFFQTIQCGEGVVGFAPSGAALSGTTGFLDQLVATQGFDDVFGLELCPSGGTLWLGGFDPSAVTAPLQYVPYASSVYSSYYYVVGLTSVTVSGTTVPVATAKYSDAVVDTGTNVFIVPTAAYSAITSAIAESPAFVQIFGADAGAELFSLQTSADAGALDASGDIDAGISAGQGCATVAQTRAELDAMLPPLTLTFGSNPGVEVQATATQSYLFQAGKDVWCSAIGAVDPSPTFPFDSIVGTPVLQSSIVVFDRVNRRLGFAPHAPCP